MWNAVVCSGQRHDRFWCLQPQHTTAFHIEVTYYATKPGCRDLSITCAHNIYSRTLRSLEDNLKMASRGRNMQMSSIVIETYYLTYLFISVIKQLDAQNFCFTISLFHPSTCFEHVCSSSGGQNCITQPLVSRGCVMHVLETCRGMK